MSGRHLYRGATNGRGQRGNTKLRGGVQPIELTRLEQLVAECREEEEGEMNEQAEAIRWLKVAEDMVGTRHRERYVRHLRTVVLALNDAQAALRDALGGIDGQVATEGGLRWFWLAPGSRTELSAARCAEIAELVRGLHREDE